MAGTLYVVATPIGHLDDITVRALRVLREVAVVAAEDTRRTGNMLRHFGISTRLISLRHHNERTRAASMVELLSPRSVGGAGYGCRYARHLGPGAPPWSAWPAPARFAWNRSPGPARWPPPSPWRAWRTTRSCFWASRLFGRKTENSGSPALNGWRPRPPWCSSRPRTECGGHSRILSIWSNTRYCSFRELTKVHEETLVGSPEELLARLEQPQGEFTVVIPRVAPAKSTSQPLDKQEIVNEFWQMTSVGSSRREIAREVGRKFGLSTRQVYEMTKDQPQ